MNKKRFIGISLTILSAGISLARTRITGAVIGGGSIDGYFLTSILTLLTGVVLIYISGLQERTRTISGLEQTTQNTMPGMEGAQPLFMDTSFLIQACKEKGTYQEVREFIQTRHDEGFPVIVPTAVLGELKGNMTPQQLRKYGLKQGDQQRINLLKELLRENTTTLETLRPNYAQDQEERIRYQDRAADIMKNTTKHYLHRERLRGGNHEKADHEILANALFLLQHPDRFGDKALKRVTILSRDGDLHEARTLQQRKYPSIDGGITAYHTLQEYIQATRQPA